MGRQLRLNFYHSIDEITKILLVGESELNTIDAYDRLLHILKQLGSFPKLDYHTCQRLKTIIGFIPSGISSNEEEVAKLALNCMSLLVQNTGFVSSISNEMAIESLLSLVELIKTTKSNEMFKKGVECILAQKFEPYIMSSQLSHVLEGILQAVNNTSLSVADVFEALNQFSIQMPGRMRELAHLWAAVIYEKLLSSDEAERRMADSYLWIMKAIVLPPTPLLAKVVAESVQNKLLLCIQRMIQVQSSKVPAINAWGWFIWLLGGRVLQNRPLVNSMLKILEQTFLDTDIDVRIASQVAWKSMVDILLPTSSVNVMDQDFYSGSQEPFVQLTSKRMKLLITPLVGTMTVEKSAKSRNSCWMICIYILQKLASSVNKISVMQHIIVPIFESIFKSGRNNWNLWVWDSCASLFEEFISLKVNEKAQASALPIDGPPIKWSPWMLCHMEYLLKIFEILWNSYSRDVTGTENKKICLKFVMRIWQLLLEGLDMEVKDAAEPSSELRAAVHLLLQFVNSIVDDVALLFISNHDRDLVFSLWSMFEYMALKVKPLVLLSSFYKLSVNTRIENGKVASNVVAQSASGLVGDNLSCKDTVQFEEMVTPIAYASTIWLRFITSLGLHRRKNSEVLNLKVDDYWLLCVWRAFAEHRLVLQAESVSESLCGSRYKSRDQFLLCLLIFPCLVSSISNAKEIIDKTKDTIFSNAVSSSGDVWFLTEDFSKICDPRTIHLFFMISGQSQQYMITSSNHEYPVQMTNLNVSECSLLMSIRCHFATIYGRFVVCLVQEMLSFINRNDIFAPSQPDSIAGTLSVASRFLILMYEARKIDTKSSNAINRVFEALGSLSKSLRTQHDILSFVQTLSEPLAKWLCTCSDPENHSTRNHMIEELEEISSFKPTENSRMACENVVKSDDLDGSTKFIGANGCEDRRILALVSRYFILAWEAQHGISKIHVESVSRVCEGLICFSRYLKTQHYTLQFMQALSKPLVKWFSGCVHSAMSDDTGQRMLLVKIWHQLLVSLQNCHPPISFDSDLLNLQAPLLASAFQCPFKPIAEQTLLFWEKTYGIRTSILSYPSCLVPVLRDLQHKVKIALPGFLHTYFSRRCLKHQIKHQVQECCATGNGELFSDAADGHNKEDHANIVTIGVQAEICLEKNEAKLVSNLKTSASNENVTEVRRKRGRPRKHKTNVIETNVCNNVSKKTAGEQYDSDLVGKIAVEHIGINMHTNEGDIELNGKLSTAEEKVEVTKVKARGRPKHKLGKYKSVVTGKKTVGRKGNARSLTDSVKCDQQSECNRDDITGDRVFNCKRVISKELIEKAKVNLKQGRTIKSERLQLKLLKSDLKTLGIRHLRSLRNAGGLRGGKDWRNAHEMAKRLPKICRRQIQQLNMVKSNDFNSVTDTHTNMRVSGANFLNMGKLDHELKTNKEEVQPFSPKKFSPLICSEPDTFDKACQTSKQSATESPFKVRALGGRTWSGGQNLSKLLEDSYLPVPFTCNAYSMSSSEKNSDSVSRKNWRKSGTPKRIPSNLICEDKEDIFYENNILSQVKAATDEEINFTGKRLRDAGHKLFTSKDWETSDVANPFKKLKHEDSKGFVKRQNAKFKSKDGVNPCHATQGCQDDMASSAGFDLQVPTLIHQCKSGRKSNLERQQEASIFDINRHRPESNPEELEARNEDSCEAHSEATDRCTETDGLDKIDHRRIVQVYNLDSQSVEEDQQLKRKTQQPELNASSATSHEVCVEALIVNPLEHACTTNGETHNFSKKGLALLEEMGSEWNICDILSELSRSSKLEGLGRQDLIHTEMLLLGLTQTIAKRKKLLLERRW
ncbi:uncharacterized protein LOC131080026 isoform X1 [Cryptomeria japonica]|uniref:uncharacterized protein LOC131080026 isoform X1 n=2 Tax=Cryptomeria japonica TaxID=3369 RepID=UPI0027DA3F85|nr:uncharacterized protein LOC131080026 isoform X1 [Cryptomeria japonica]